MSYKHKSKDSKMIPNILYLLALICLMVGWTVCFWLLLNKVLTPRYFALCFITVGCAAYVIARINYVTELELWGAKIKTAVAEAKTTIQKLEDTIEKVSEHQTKIESLVSIAEQQEKRLEKIVEETKPPILLLDSSIFKSKKRGDGISQKFRLFPDKNVALGRVIIYATIVDTTNSKILRMEFVGRGLTQQAKTTVRPQANSAWKIFFPPVPIPLDMEIVVSEPCEVSFEGTYVIKPSKIKIESPSE